MTDYISREALENWVREEVASLDSKEDREFVIQRWRKEIPATDVAPVVHGRWVYNPGDNIPYCSECMMPQDSECNFCPSCGAKMDGKQEKLEARKRDLENARRSMEEAIATPVVDVTRWQYPQLMEEEKQDAKQDAVD